MALAAARNTAELTSLKPAEQACSGLFHDLQALPLCCNAEIRLKEGVEMKEIAIGSWACWPCRGQPPPASPHLSGHHAHGPTGALRSPVPTLPSHTNVCERAFFCLPHRWLQISVSLPDPDGYQKAADTASRNLEGGTIQRLLRGCERGERTHSTPRYLHLSILRQHCRSRLGSAPAADLPRLHKAAREGLLKPPALPRLPSPVPPRQAPAGPSPGGRP